ncbi:MAG: DUF3109 family protein [Flavobacteriales bacterium]
MVEIDDKLISMDIFEKKFVCDLAACKGACCVEGHGGAPVEEEEIELLEKHFSVAKKYLDQESIDAVEKQGFFVVGSDGGLETPLKNEEECAYVYFDRHGTAKCSYDTAYRNGEIDWMKPISCHLYPIRLTDLKTHTALNYHKWGICAPACDCGSKLDVPIYKFLKEPLIRKFGEEFYAEVERAADILDTSK